MKMCNISHCVIYANSVPFHSFCFFSSVSLPKSVDHFRKQREQVVKRAMEVCNHFLKTINLQRSVTISTWRKGHRRKIKAWSLKTGDLCFIVYWVKTLPYISILCWYDLKRLVNISFFFTMNFLYFEKASLLSASSVPLTFWIVI